MKNIFGKIIITLLACVLFISCSLEPDHSIRIHNSYYTTMVGVKVGSLNFGNIASGTTTNYQPIMEGSHVLSGVTADNQPWSGTATIKGKGRHDWTMTITSTGGVTFKEDK